MSALSSVLVKFTADISNVTQGMATATKAVTNTASNVGKMSGKFSGYMNKINGSILGTVGQVLTLGGIVAAAKSGFNFDAEIQNTTTQLSQFVGGVDNAKKVVKDMQTLSLTAPFTFASLATGVTNFVAAGASVKDAEKAVKTLGDAVAATGGTQEKYNNSLYAYNQIMTSGVLNMQDLYQLNNAIPGTMARIAKARGESIAQFRKEISLGKVMSADVLPQINTAYAQFDGAMGRSSGTFSGLMSNLKETTTMIMGLVVAPLFNFLQVVLPPIISALQGFVQWIQNLPAPVKFALGVFMGIVTVLGIVGVAVTVFGGIWTAMIGVLTAVGLTNPIILIIIATIAVLAGLGYLIYKHWGGIKQFFVNMWNGIKTITMNVWNGLKGFFMNVFNVLKFLFMNFTPAGIILGHWNQIWNGTTRVFNRIKSFLQGVINGIKNIFRGIHIPLPHFSVTSSFKIGGLSIPKSFGVNWYAKGGVFNGASVIGVGERGSEAVVPLQGSRMAPFADAIARQMVKVNHGNTGGNSNQFHIASLVVREEADIQRIARELYRLQERNRRAKG